MEKLGILAIFVTWVFLGGSHAQRTDWPGYECPPFGLYYGGSIEYSTDPPLFAGATANLSCGIGYEPLENYTTATCSSLGQWVPHKLQCELPCPELELTDFLLVSTTELYPGVLIHFTCENGAYHLSGPNYLTCRNGSWSDRLPSCTEPLCDLIQWNDKHLDVQTSRLDYRRVNSTASFSCDSGWRIVGAESITCLPGGVWSDYYPYCERDSSPVPSLQTTLFPTTSTSSEAAILSSTVPSHLQRTPLLSPASTFLNLPTPISSALTEVFIHIQRTPVPSPKVSTYLQETSLLSPLPTQTKESPSSGSSGSKVGPIAGGVAGGLAIAVVSVIVIGMVVIFHRGIKRHPRRGGYVVHATEDQVNLPI